MSSQASNDLSATVMVSSSPREVFDAINNVAAWWTGDIEGSAQDVGATFTYRFKDFHVSKQTVTELVPGHRIVWRVDEANLSFLKNKTEWEGTKVVFELRAVGDQTEIHFTHEGLKPDCECFEACRGGWDFYIKKSLPNLILNGKGLAPKF